MTNIQITSERSGYPRNLRNGVINFDSYQQAQQHAQENNGEVCLLSKRDGHDLWINHGERYSSLTSDDYLRDLGDNYQEYDSDSINELFMSEIKEAKDIDEVKTLIALFDKIEDHVNELEEEEVIIMTGLLYYDTCKKVLMSYHEDVTTYAIGVIYNEA